LQSSCARAEAARKADAPALLSSRRGWVSRIERLAKQLFRVAGETKQARKRLRSGRTSVRNFCPACGSLMSGGEYGVSAQHTIYAGTLDDPSAFHPTHAVMLADRPHWAAVLDGLELHEGTTD
jgi:hypothetical protein